MSKIPDDVIYTRDHEWISSENGIVTVGISSYAVEQFIDNGRRSWPDNPFDGLETKPSGHTTDVTDADSVSRLVEQTVETYGKIDVWVNNAGRSSRGLAKDISAEEFADLLELNFLALVRCSQAAIPHLLTSSGHLVNIGSLSAKTASPYMGGYAASKHPVAAYSQQLRLENNPRDLHVLLDAPGPIRRQDDQPRYQDQSRNLPATAGTAGGGVKLKGICPKRLSAKIIRACQRRQPELVVPAKARLLFALAQLCPRLGDWIVKKMTGHKKN